MSGGHEDFARWAEAAGARSRDNEVQAQTYALLAIYHLLEERLPKPGLMFVPDARDLGHVRYVKGRWIAEAEALLERQAQGVDDA